MIKPVNLGAYLGNIHWVDMGGESDPRPDQSKRKGFKRSLRAFHFSPSNEEEEPVKSADVN